MADEETQKQSEHLVRLGSSASQAESDSSKQSEKKKVEVLLKAAGDAPIMKKKKWSVDGTKTVAYLIEFIRKYIKCEPSESLFLYVGQSFAPCPDHLVQNIYDELWSLGDWDKKELTSKEKNKKPVLFVDFIHAYCFGADGKLVFHYCKSQAWG